MNPLQRLRQYGQSPWLDFIQRSFVTDGSLQKLIEEDGIVGVTSNPAIFEKAILGSADYDDLIVSLTGEGKSAADIYDHLSIEDVGMAADLFKEVYEETKGLDGYVSLEVSPHLADDTEGTIADARRLWKALNRLNVMIKVPATPAGVPAIKALIADGININVTLLFSVERYREVALAYIEGLEERASKGLDLRVASVASFFVSRVDTMLDPILEEKGDLTSQALIGQVAIANSYVAYGVFEELFGSERFKDLENKGAWVQRLLWASTSVKNPAYSPVKYADALVGRYTVDTLPLETIIAYREQGDPADRLSGSLPNARITMSQLETVGINIEEIAEKLEKEAIDKFVQPFDKLISAIESKRESVVVG
ncbi:transaldolase [Kamptonema cortianum]|nr:transaldolase [Geitlerinema splendidum]MDK3157572.1 transaldolase [Kamptonema cortianum]